MLATSENFTALRDIFAVIGALGTVGGLGWRIFTWRHDQIPHVDVKNANGFPTYGPNNERAGEHCFMVRATNRGDHPVHVTAAGFLLPDGEDSTLVIMHPPFPDALPGTVRPRDSGQTWVDRSAVEGRGIGVVGGALVGWVDLSTGERIKSKPTMLVAAEKLKAA